MAKYLVSFEIEADGTDLEELKKLEHHADYLLDLANWPEIKSVSNFKVDSPEELTKERLMDIFTSYVNNDAEGTDPDYIREVLTDVCGLSDNELRALGMDWVIQEDEGE